MATVAVVGLGAMGSRMAKRLLDAGHDVAVWNRSPERAAELVGVGATLAATPAEAARGRDFAITMVTDPAALVEVTEGDDGVLAGGPETLIQMSTVGPPATARLVAAIRAGTELVDAPVVGSRAQAEGGTLTIYVGASDELAARVTPLLSVLGTPIHVGSVGAASAAKLVANGVLIGTLGVFGEALVLARALGLSQDAALEVLGTTALASQVELRRPQLEDGDFPPRFALSLARKDADLIAATGADLPLDATMRGELAAAEAAGLGDRDFAVLLRWLLDR